MIPVTLQYHLDGEYDPVAPYTDNQSLLDNMRGLIVRERSAVHVTFGQPISLHDHTRKQAAELARSAIVDALGRPVRLPLPEGATVTA